MTLPNPAMIIKEDYVVGAEYFGPVYSDNIYNLTAEQRERIVNSYTPRKTPAAIKHDQGKVDWAILPIGASEEIIKVFQFGAEKYARGNFLDGEGLAYTRVLNSLLRHTYAFMRGEDTDPESGLSHMAHAGANVYMLLSYELNKAGRTNDDRAANVLK